MKTIFTKFTHYRVPQFQICTKVMIDGKKKIVAKQPLSSQGRDHIVNIEKNYHLLKTISTSFEVCPCYRDGDTVYFEFLHGDSLEKFFLNAIKDADTNRLYQLIEEFKTIVVGDNSNIIDFYSTKEFETIFGDILSNQTGVQALQIANLDCTASNVICVDEKKFIIDYEFVWQFPIPLDFVLYRFACLFANDHFKALESTITREVFMELFQFSLDTNVLHAMTLKLHDFFCRDEKTKKDFFEIKNQYAKSAFTYKELLFELDDSRLKIKQNEIVMQQEIERREMEIMQVRATAQKIQLELTQSQLDLTQSQQGLTQSQLELVQSRQELTQSQLELVQSRQELTQFQSELAQERLQLEQVYASDSWKITKPLRAISSAIKRGMKRNVFTRTLLRTAVHIKYMGWGSAASIIVGKLHTLSLQANKKNMKKALKYIFTFNFSSLINGIRFVINNRQTSPDCTNCEDLIVWYEENVIENFVLNHAVYQHEIDLIVPIYNGYEYLTPLFSSISKTNMRYNLILINDCSPDERILPFLKSLVNVKGTVTIQNNEQNLGFVKTVNKGLSLSNNHVVLINTDIELPNLWLERLIVPLLSEKKVASATPFTNSGTICSFPNFCENNELYLSLSTDEIDCSFRQIKPKYVRAPTGVGFCMAMHKNALKKIGFLDDQTFVRGYGEENDWCQRAIKAGFCNVIVDNLFVYHKHGGSFVSEEKEKLIQQNSLLLSHKHPNYTQDVSDYCRDDPHKMMRIYLKIKLSLEQNNKKTILIFDHNLGGGATSYCDKYCKKMKEEGYPIALVRYWGKDSIQYSLTLTLREETYRFAFYDMKKCLKLISSISLERIVINELVTYPELYALLNHIIETKKEHAITITMLLHDYFSVCPTIVLLNRENQYCGLVGMGQCEGCLKNNRLNNYSACAGIQEWRANWGRFLKTCDCIIVFSNSSKDILLKAYPSLENITVTPHQVSYISPIGNWEKKTDHLTIGVIGAIDERKGILVIEEMLALIKEKELPIRIVLIGYHNKMIQNTNFVETGRYEPAQILELTRKNDIDIFFIPSVWPETFSYTTEEAIKMGMPVACFDLGAPAERVSRYEKGLVISQIDSAYALDEIQSFASLFK